MQEITYKDIRVAYEDNAIIVVEKPQNIPTQADESQDMDMLTLVKTYIKETHNKPGEAFVGMVQRLDRPTGGIMVFAKNSKAASRLSESMRFGEIEKKYLAVVCGVPKTWSGKLTHYLKKSAKDNTVVIAPMSIEGAKYAELDYKVLEDKQGFALIHINLITGRSHQARVQMASLGTPIFGDKKYGALEKTAGYNLALWACELKFPHPTTRDIMVFRCYPNMATSPWKAFNIDKYLNIDINNVETFSKK